MNPCGEGTKMGADQKGVEAVYGGKEMCRFIDLEPNKEVTFKLKNPWQGSSSVEK